MLRAKYILVEGQIKVREFFIYDENGARPDKIIDDGWGEACDDLSGVTERRIKRIQNLSIFPVGLPEIVEERYLDLTIGQERLLSRIVNTYNNEGRLATQAHYDANNQFLYTLLWEYNRRGQVIKEVNPLGYITERQYDDNGNMFYERGPRHDFHTELSYDHMNRLIAKQEVWHDHPTNPTRLIEKYTYDYMGHCLCSTDIYGHETRYEYDDFGRVIKIIQPEVKEENGSTIHPEIYKEYDILDNVIAITDASGARTSSEYTIRGKPYHIAYPDGTHEYFEYTLKGELIKTIDRNGSLYSISMRLSWTPRDRSGFLFPRRMP